MSGVRMSEDKSYCLVFLVDGRKVTEDDLRTAIARTLGKHSSDVYWELAKASSGYWKLSIDGPLQPIDSCHARLNRDFFPEHLFVRLRDEAGDEIRQRVYPILGRIEQQLRAFINCAMIEVGGFAWWDSVAPSLTTQEIQDGVKHVEKQIGSASEFHHPLELALFEHLVLIVTSSTQAWPSTKSLTIEELAELLADCWSIEELKAALLERTREVSLWDQVFARYFENVEDWKNLAHTLRDFVIPLRNKVMHHRPVFRYELRKLVETDQTVTMLLASAVTELSQEDRSEAHQISEEWTRMMARDLRMVTDSLSAMRDITEPFRKWEDDMSRLRAAVEDPFLKMRDVMEPFRKWQDDMSRLRAAVEDPFLKMRDVMEPFRKWQDDMSRLRKAMQIPFLTIEDSLKPDLIEEKSPMDGSESYIASRDGKKFHRLTCMYVDRILSEHQLSLADRKTAIEHGYKPCAICRP
jgi:hypothetical protein